MFDRALAKTFANLSTLFLVALVFALPVHIVQAYVFREILAVQEIAPEIASFPEGRQVRGVARADFTAERLGLAIAVGIELLTLPLVYRASKRVMEVDEAGEVPTVPDAWRNLGSSSRPALLPGPLIVTAVIATAGALLVVSIGNMLADMASANVAWAVLGLGRATAMALLLALVAGVAAAAPEKERPRAAQKIDLY